MLKLTKEEVIDIAESKSEKYKKICDDHNIVFVYFKEIDNPEKTYRLFYKKGETSIIENEYPPQDCPDVEEEKERELVVKFKRFKEILTNTQYN